MPNQIGQLLAQTGIGVAGNAASSLMGIALGGINANQQEIQNRRLMNVQKGMQMEITDHNMAKQLELWKATNYGAQKAELEKAGLNPALMYGMGGGGGSTASIAQGNISGATAQGNYAPQNNEFGIQMQMLQAQKANIEADTKLKEATATKTSGVDTQKAGMEIQSLTQGIQNQKALEQLTKVQTEIANFQKDLASGTLESNIDIAKKAVTKIQAEVDILQTQYNVDANTAKTKIALVKRELYNSVLDSAIKQAQAANISQDTQLKLQQLKTLANDVQISWENIANQHTALSQKALEIDWNTSGLPKGLNDLLSHILIAPIR